MPVKSTYSISDLSSQAPAVVRQAEKKGSVTLCRNGRVVGFLISRERMEAILETMELLANPKAMQAIRDYEAGRTTFKDISRLNEDEG